MTTEHDCIFDVDTCPRELAEPRPAGWECPWCGPAGLPIDVSLPPHLQLCDTCYRAATMPEAEVAASWDRYYNESLERARDEARARLRPILDKFWIAYYGPAWPGFNFAKAWAMNSVLAAMEASGLDRKAEFDLSIERMPPATRARFNFDTTRDARTHRLSPLRRMTPSPGTGAAR